VIERQGHDLKGVDFSKTVDNSLVNPLVNEKYFETVFESSIRDEQQRKQMMALEGSKEASRASARSAKSLSLVSGQQRNCTSLEFHYSIIADGCSD